ncbi:MAG: hypothetical protein ACQKBW_07510 [Puniceicoccales bacterium]
MKKAPAAIFLTILLCFILFVIWVIPHRHSCVYYRDMAKDADVARRLVDWVDQTFPDAVIPPDMVVREGGFGPALVCVNVDFPESILPPGSKVLRVGLVRTPYFNDDGPFVNYSLYISDQNRRGLLIRFEDSKWLPHAKAPLEVVTPRIAVYCAD